MCLSADNCFFYHPAVVFDCRQMFLFSGSIEFVEFVEMMAIGKKGIMADVFYQMAHKHEQMAGDKRQKFLRERNKFLKQKQIKLAKKNKKASLRAEAKKTLTTKELKAAKDSFEAIDVDEDQSLDLDELGDAFKALGVKMKRTHLVGLFAAVDIDGDGSLDLDEFIVCVAQCKKHPKYAKKFAAIGVQTNVINNIKARLELDKKKEKLRQQRSNQIQLNTERADYRAKIRKKFSKIQLSRLLTQFNQLDR